jgi:hypothetical protein
MHKTLYAFFKIMGGEQGDFKLEVLNFFVFAVRFRMY